MHALNVMNAITLMVDTLDDAEGLINELKIMGVNHRKRRIEAVHFHVSIPSVTERKHNIFHNKNPTRMCGAC